MSDAPLTPGTQRPRVLRFGVFHVDLHTRELFKRGARVRLQQQPFRVLEMLLEKPGDVVLREDVQKQLWPADTFVDFEQGLNKAVAKLRDALGDSAENPRFVETLAKRGYRFLAPVEVVSDRSVDLASVAAVEAADGEDVVVDDDTTPSDPSVGLAPPTAPIPPSIAVAPLAPIDAPAPPARIESVETTDTAPPVPPALPAAATARPRTRGRWPVAVAAAAIAAVLAGGWYLRPRDDAPLSSTRAMLAVLPFASLEQSGDAYFSDGMTEEMIMQLGSLNPTRLGVIARTSAMAYKGTAKRVDEIGRELGVQYVLEGSVRRSVDRVRIAARLVRTADQTPLWSESYERDAADVLSLQSDVAGRIADALVVTLLPQPANRARVNPDVFDAYLKGRDHWNRRTPQDLLAAVETLERAVGQDAAYPPAAAALADALNVLPWYGLRAPRDVYPRSMAVSRQALEVDPMSAAAHTSLAYAHHYFDWDWPSAEREYARALQLNPNYAQASQWYAAHLAETGRFDEALEQMRRAQQLDPRSLIVSAAIGWIDYLARRHDSAIGQLEATLRVDPTFVPARLWLGQALEAAGRVDDAMAQYRRVRDVAGTASTGLGELARGLAVTGRAADATAALDQLLGIARTRYVEADLIARVYAGLGDVDKAIEWLERGYDERAAKMTLIGVDPQFDRLRADPRFRALVERMRLPLRP